MKHGKEQLYSCIVLLVYNIVSHVLRMFLLLFYCIHVDSSRNAWVNKNRCAEPSCSWIHEFWLLKLKKNGQLLTYSLKTDTYFVATENCTCKQCFREIGFKLDFNDFNGHLLSDLIETDIFLISVWKRIFIPNFVEIA